MKKVCIFFAVFFIIVSFISFGLFIHYRNFDINKLVVKSVNYSNNTFTIEVSDYYGNMYCGVKSKTADDLVMNSFNDNTCKYKITKPGNYDLYIENETGTRKITGFDKVYSSVLKTKKRKFYLAEGDSVKLSYSYVSVGDSSMYFKSNNKKIAYVKNGVLYAKSSGTTKITFGKEIIDVVVTDLIDKMPKEYNYNRSYISCGVFSTKEAVLLDEILFDRVKTAGEGTRAGVVAAARFLTLEFPYRINYFSENGRLGPPYAKIADGEGRYYHKGLYLSTDKYEDISHSIKGPAMWGCPMYSKPSKKKRSNGLDCSGFTTWAVYNGGFDIGDLPAHGGNSAAYNLNDIGKEVRLTYDIAMSDKIKAGDLLGEVTVSEGHSALVVGVDDNYYYVAESLWIPPYGVNINKYKRSELANNFETVNLMDSYYKKQGNYTAMWY